jgi:hypothetical protein
VVSLGSGQARRWITPRGVSWTPQLNYRGAWTADGRILALQEGNTIRNPSRQAELHWHPPATTQVSLIDTLAPAPTLAVHSLVLRSPAGESPLAQVFLTPDGAKLIGATGRSDFAPTRGSWTGELSVYSARTGALLQQLAQWIWNGADHRPGHGGTPRELIAWSNYSGSQLILLHPAGELNVLGVLAGHRFSQARAPLPQASGYRELDYALRTASQVAW